MIPIASVLGQLKWLWFKKSAGPLTDFQLYDCAGSGGWGSLKFSLKLRILLKSWVTAFQSAVKEIAYFGKAHRMASRRRRTQCFIYIFIDATVYRLCFCS
jgi:hypothetical protein